MPHEIFLAVSLSLIGAVALALVIYLLFIRTKREGEIMRAYRGVSFAHRGLHGEGRAENSLSAFSAAAEEGFGIELDVRLSKDGKLVVFHDDTLTRVAGIDERVDAKTLEELRKCRLSGTNDTARCVDAMALRQALNGFLATLSREKRCIFLRRYWYMDSVAEISRRFALSESKVKTTLLRCRRQLRAHLEKEGFSL